MTNQTINDKSFFYCYNKKLSDYIVKSGYRYIVKAKSVKDNNVFTMFLKSDELNRIIRCYLVENGLCENTQVHHLKD